MKDYDNLYNLLSIENNKDKKYYVFIRLYDCVYKNKLSPGAILDKGIKLVSTEIESLNLKYNHASINYNLNDMFYGLTAAGGDFSLKFETCGSKEKTGNVFIDSCDKTTSKFSIFYSEISYSDFKKLCNILNASKDTVKYDCFLNIRVSTHLIIEKIKNMFFKKSNETLKSTFSKYQVCSTFCAFVLKQLSKFEKYISDEKVYDPDSLVNKLHLTHLCSGTWNEYNDKIKDVISKNKQMKEYFTRSIK